MRFTGSDLSTVAVAMVSIVGKPLSRAQMIPPSLRLSHRMMCRVFPRVHTFQLGKHFEEDAVSNVKKKTQLLNCLLSCSVQEA